jgi:hypothetical protein
VRRSSARERYYDACGIFPACFLTCSATIWYQRMKAGSERFTMAAISLTSSLVPATAAVPEEWLQHAREARVLGHCVPVISPTEPSWSKAFIEKRNRHDGSINLMLKQLDRVKDSFS